jgi:hypothetical protein
VHDGEAQAGATEAPAHAVVGLSERGENVLQCIRLDTDTSVLDIYLKPPPRVAVSQ